MNKSFIEAPVKELLKELGYTEINESNAQEVIEKIGEGASSIAYKIIDKRYNKIMCKKVLKVEEGKTTFKKLQNSVKEFEALSSLHNP